MEQPVAPGEAPRSRRGLWIGLAAGIGGCMLLVVILCVALGLAGSIFGRRVAKNATTSWTDAAGKTSLELYEPGYVPSDAGEPQIIPIGLGGVAQTVTAKYSGGLTIAQVNRAPNARERQEQVDVEGADEAWYGNTRDGRALTVHKNNTWITIAGRTDGELIKIAESLRRVNA